MARSLYQHSAIVFAALCPVALGQTCVDPWGSVPGNASFSGSPGSVHALVEFAPPGQNPTLFAGGSFAVAGQSLVRNVARWNGSAWASAGWNLNGSVNDFEVFDFGTGPLLYAGGSFRNNSSTTDIGVRVWDGTDWNSIGGPDGTVTQLIVHNDGSGSKLYACGEFLTTGGTTTLRIARFDGQAWSAVGTGLANISPLTMASVATGNRPGLTVAGYPLLGPNAARWNGTTWSQESIVNPFNAPLSLQPYGGTLISSSDASGGVYRASTSTPSWTALAGFGTSSYTGNVQTMLPFNFGTGPELFLAGDFVQLSCVPPVCIGGLAAFNGSTTRAIFPDGWHERPLIGAGPVRALAAGTSPQQLYFAGSFDGVRQTFTPNGPVTPPTIRLNSIGSWNGSQFGVLGEGLTTPGVRTLFKRAEGGQEVIYVGGSFREINGQPIAYLARFDGTTWTAPAPTLQGEVIDIAESSEGLFVLGRFTGPNTIGQRVNNIALVSNAGSVTIFTLPGAAVPDQLASGIVGGQHRVFVATRGPNGGIFRRENGGWVFAASLGMNAVNDLEVLPTQTGSAVYACGLQSAVPRVIRYDGFVTAELVNGMLQFGSQPQQLWTLPGPTGPRLHVAGVINRLGASGTLARFENSMWTLLDQTPYTVNGLTSFDDGSGETLFATTRTRHIDGPASFLKWTGTSWARIGDFDQQATCLLDVGNSLLVGGDFTSVDSESVAGLISYQSCPRCPADFNQDGGVDADDVIAFFASWDVSNPLADFDMNGDVDGDDVIQFFSRWDAAC